MVLAIVCPGQGSQSPGFLSPWLELPGTRDHLTELGEMAGVDLIRHGTESDAETIKDTAVAQPLIVAAGLVAARALFDGDAANHPNAANMVFAGHSVGEITASALSGALSEADAMAFVRERANAMAEAAARTPTGMSAVLGGDPDEVSAAIGAAGLTAANVNAAGQTVAAGTLDQLQNLAGDPPAKARVMPLKVAGAFHTEHMAPAVGVLEQLRPDLQPRDPSVTLLSNYDGGTVASGEANLDSLIAQVSRPVRWDLCMEQFKSLGVSSLVELPPAGTLAGLAKRGLSGVTISAVKSADDVESARDLIKTEAAEEGIL